MPRHRTLTGRTERQRRRNLYSRTHNNRNENPNSVNIKENEEANLGDTPHGSLNPSTGVIQSSKYPCTDPLNVSDEEQPTAEGVSKTKKRAWHRSGKQEWLKIYEEYMQKRSIIQPQPLDSQGLQGKSAGRRVSKNADKKGRKSKLCSSKDDRTMNVQSDDLKRVKTVRDLKQCDERLRVRRDLVGVAERDGAEDRGELQPSTQDSSPGSSGGVTTDGNLTQDVQNDSVAGDLPSCERIKVEDEDFSEGEIDKKIYLDLNSDEEETGRQEANHHKVMLQNLRYNALQLLKYSNICLFKWTKHYFVCYECLERFKDMKALRKHMEDAHTCDDVVSKIFKEIYTFSNADITDLECKMCRVMLNSLKELEDHVIEHDVILKPGGSSLVPYKLCTDAFTCQLCGEVFDMRYRLKKHMDEHVLNYICPECVTGSPDSNSIKRHCRAHNESVNEMCRATLKYVTCKKKLKCRGSGLDEARLKCSQCPKSFKYDYRRLQHFIKEHNKDIKLFKCEFCPKMFMTVYWLTKHINCVHPDKLHS